MTFNFLKNITDGFLLKSATGPSAGGPRILALFDSFVESREEKLLENLLKISGEVFLIEPEADVFPEIGPKLIQELAGFCNDNCILVVTGKFAPAIIREYAKFNKMEKAVFINPSYRQDIATKMSSFETPCLVITGTPGNLDHDPEAVKYHDLISGSRIQYVRGVTGNPLFMKFTQSFNSIQRFISDE